MSLISPYLDVIWPQVFVTETEDGQSHQVWWCSLESQLSGHSVLQFLPGHPPGLPGPETGTWKGAIAGVVFGGRAWLEEYGGFPFHHYPLFPTSRPTEASGFPPPRPSSHTADHTGMETSKLGTKINLSFHRGVGYFVSPWRSAELPLARTVPLGPSVQATPGNQE